ncbi:MAG TPA: choice-of-anchor P family protein [Gemmatimonadales bacterium]|jgi:hypothetical protein
MKIDTMRRAIRLVGLVLPMTWMPRSALGQMRVAANAESYGVAVSTPTVNQKTPYAVLPAGGDMAQDQGQSVAVPGLVTAADLFAIATGDADESYGSNAVSSATLGAVSLLNGLISADGIVAIASSTIGGGLTGSDAEGSSVANLVVNGTSVADPAPNTRMDLPGVGYAILNEQTLTGDGVSSSGITVNMIHVVLQEPILGLLGQVIGYQTVGNIIVGSATSSVQ